MAIDSLIVGSIKLSKQRGKELSKEHPEIADEYRRNTLRELAERYSPDYEISESVAMNSVYYALRELVLRGFISEKELREIGKVHIKETGEKNGQKTGKINGLANYKAGISIGELSKKDLHNQGRETMIKRGYVPLDFRPKKTDYGRFHEGEFVIYLKEEEFLEWREIAEELVIAGFSHRTPRTLQNMYERWKKRTK